MFIIRNVTVQNESTKVRDLKVTDDSGKILPVTMLRHIADIQVAPGTEVLLKDVTVEYSAYYKSNTVGINNEEDFHMRTQLFLYDKLLFAFIILMPSLLCNMYFQD